MRTEIVRELGEPVGQVIKTTLSNLPQEQEMWIASPISNTPLPIYEWLVAHAKELENLDKVSFWMMDDMAKRINGRLEYTSETDSASFEAKIKTILIDRLSEAAGVDMSHCIKKPDLNNLEKSDQEIEEHGGLDLLILAIGEGGHYGQVMPGTDINTGFHVTELRDDYKDRHQEEGIFAGSEFQKYGMSLGHKQLLNAKQVIVIISGAKKKDLTEKLLSYNSFDPEFPLSAIYERKGETTIFITEDVGVQ